jgi:hypothetical protein
MKWPPGLSAMRVAVVPAAGDTMEPAGEDHVESLFDRALEATFPANNPVAISNRQDRYRELLFSYLMSL